MPETQAVEKPKPPIPQPEPGQPPAPTVKLWAPEHPDGCHLALLNGHTFMIPHDKAGITVPREFRTVAIANGCIPVGAEPDIIEENTLNRSVLIRKKMEAMLDGTDPKYFGGDGKPDLGVLSRMCGFQVERGERDKLWKEVEDGA